MPELPEVEIVRQGLVKALCGKGCLEIHHLEGSSRPLREAENLLWRISEAGPVKAVNRFGKYIVLIFTRPAFPSLAVHLGMTGRLVAGEHLPGDAFSRASLILSVENSLVHLTYSDTRKFGWWGPASLPDGSPHPRLAKLGPDAYRKRNELLDHFLSKTFQRSVYNALMDQSILAGLGNIYVQEILFRARIHPLRPWSSLSREDFVLLSFWIGEILSEAMKHGGISISDYVQATGEAGRYQEFHQVYGKRDQPCPVCSTSLDRVVISSRSVCFCPQCQPATLNASQKGT